MPDYRRVWHRAVHISLRLICCSGRGSDLLTRHIDLLREAVKMTQRHHPFIIHAWIVLPDYLHCIIELPPNDADFAIRWRLIKITFSKALPITERRSRVRMGER
jgi:putative transposase